MSIMSQKYIVLCLMFQLLVEINCQPTPFKPIQRYVHTATLINNKLYIFGGAHFVNDIKSKDFFYLDVSVPFNTQQLLWQDLSNINTVPAHYGATSVKGGADNNTLFLYGGATDTTAALVYTFNPQNNVWSVPTIAGVNSIRKRNLMGVIDSNGKMYLWGGSNVINGNNVNDMFILDTVNPNWGKGSLLGAPSPRVNFAAVLSPDNNIIYIGGYSKTNNIELTLNQVYVYNTISDSWNTKVTTGIVPTAREGFSAVLGLVGQRIIIFGGTADVNFKPLDIGDSLYVLNLNNFEWYIPKTSGQIPKSRMYHTANVIGKYMVISFGGGYLQSTESDILLLDISNNDEYKWTNTFELSSPSPPQPPSPPPPSSSSSPPQPPTIASMPSSPSSLSSNNNSAMVGTAIGSSIGGFLLAAICFLLYKRYKLKQRQKNSIPTPGSESHYHNHHENLAIPRNTYNQGRGQEVPIYNNIYNHGREAVPIANNNEKLSLQNIDEGLLQHLVQTVRQEVTQNLRQETQNNGQASNSNITRNSHYH